MMKCTKQFEVNDLSGSHKVTQVFTKYAEAFSAFAALCSRLNASRFVTDPAPYGDGLLFVGHIDGNIVCELREVVKTEEVQRLECVGKLYGVPVWLEFTGNEKDLQLAREFIERLPSVKCNKPEAALPGAPLSVRDAIKIAHYKLNLHRQGRSGESAQLYDALRVLAWYAKNDVCATN